MISFRANDNGIGNSYLDNVSSKNSLYWEMSVFWRHVTEPPPQPFLDKNWQTAVNPKYLPFFRRFVNRKYHLVHGLYYSATVKQHPAYYWYHFLTSFVLLDFDPILSKPEYAKVYVPKVWTVQGTADGANGKKTNLQINFSSVHFFPQ